MYEAVKYEERGDCIITCKPKKTSDVDEVDEAIQTLIDIACVQIAKLEQYRSVTIEILDDIPGERIEDLTIIVSIRLHDVDKRVIMIEKRFVQIEKVSRMLVPF